MDQKFKQRSQDRHLPVGVEEPRIRRALDAAMHLGRAHAEFTTERTKGPLAVADGSQLQEDQYILGFKGHTTYFIRDSRMTQDDFFKHPKPSNNSRSVKTEVFFWVEVGNLDVDMQHLCCIYSAMTGKQLKKLLEQNGWRLDRISGSHHILVRDGKRSIPVPVHGSADLPKGLVHAILKQAEIKE